MKTPPQDQQGRLDSGSLNQDLTSIIIGELGTSHPLKCQDKTVYFKHKILEFPTGSSLALCLFKLFSQAPLPYVLYKSTIVTKLYSLDPKTLSPRRRVCVHNNMNKAIARCRRLALSHFDDPGNPLWDWFVYNPALKQYSLIQPRNETPQITHPAKMKEVSASF